MVPEINYLAVIAATLSTMVVGSIWYTPKVFGNLWMRLAKVPRVTGTRAAVAPIIATLIVSFVTAWVLAGSVYISQQFYGGSFLGNAMITGLVLFAGFTAARFITHDAFERRPAPLTVLNVTHELVTVVIMSFIIGIWPPA